MIDRATVIQAERATLGSMLLDVANIDAAKELVGNDDFVDPVHQLLYRIILDLRHSGCTATQILDHLRVIDDIQRLDGGSYIVKLIDSVPLVARFEYCASIVTKAANERRICK